MYVAIYILDGLLNDESDFKPDTVHGDVDLHKTIQAATCKSEEFNEFARWLLFANGGKTAANLKHEQNKIVKFNHLLANVAILCDVNAMTKAFNELREEGYDIKREHMAKFSPYHTAHLGRLRSFELDLTRAIVPIDYDLQVGEIFHIISNL